MRKGLVVALTVMSLAWAGAAIASPGGNGNGNAYGLGNGNGPPGYNHPRGNGPPEFRGAPGPIAGVGLPVLLAAGAYVWVRRRRDRARTDKSGPSA
jgi:hypothetical protein